MNKRIIIPVMLLGIFVLSSSGNVNKSINKVAKNGFSRVSSPSNNNIGGAKPLFEKLKLSLFAKKGITAPHTLPSRSGQVLSKIKYSKEDLYWLTRIVQAEAGNQPIEGQIAVANVILNRVADVQFPNTIKEVIFAKGQFSPVKNGSINNTPCEQVVLAVKRALNGERIVPYDVVYFYNPKISKDSWIRTKRSYKQIGNHLFCYKY